jgi:hypothetical protein
MILEIYLSVGIKQKKKVNQSKLGTSRNPKREAREK